MLRGQNDPHPRLCPSVPTRARRKFQEAYASEAKALQLLDEKLMKLRAPSAKLLAQVHENEMVKDVRSRALLRVYFVCFVVAALLWGVDMALRAPGHG